MDTSDDKWLADVDAADSGPGPGLEDFLALDASGLPFLQGQPVATEDFLRYRLFMDDWGSIEELRQLLTTITEMVESLAKEYIWHRQPFALAIDASPEEDLEPHLRGTQVIGGNISDEWFACYLLHAVTASISGLTASITDNDGQFLLIEAATAIPPFLSPANSENRVWLRSGEVHLVMPGCMIERARTPRTLGSGSISLSEGLKAIREGEGLTLADEGVQQLIRRRIEEYPAKAYADVHHARTFLPRAAALALRETPGIVAAAVHAYCSADATAKKSGARMARLLSSTSQGPAEERPGSGEPRFVEMRVRYTRHLYAQLRQAALIPSRAFPNGWGPKDRSLDPAAWAKAAQLGQKLSMGLEAAYQASAERCRRRADGDLRTLVSPKAWKRFMSGLEQNGFFEGELEGSKRYREKAAMAEEYLRDNVFLLEENEVTANKDSPGMDIDARRSSVHETIDDAIANAERRAESFGPCFDEDDDDTWLEVSEEDLSRLLSNYWEAGVDTEESRRHRDRRERDRDVNDEMDEAGAEDHSRVSFDDNGGRVAAGDTGKEEEHVGLEVAVSELDDIVTGMNTFVEDSRAGPDGAEVEAVGGDVRFNVEKFMSLLSGEDLMSALEEAAQEQTQGEFGGSDEELLETSEEDDEEEDDDYSDQEPRRMTAPQGSKSLDIGHGAAQVTNCHVASSSGGKAKGNSAKDVARKGTTHIETRSGLRPSVASQMREMEGRTIEDQTQGVEPAARGDGGDDKEDGRHEERGGAAAKDSLIEEYMAKMDVELNASSMAHSFEREAGHISEARMTELEMMGPLDQNKEAATEAWLGGGDSSQPLAGSQTGESIDGDDSAEGYKPVDVDMNLVKHLLESTASQGGMSGPATNLLRSMGLTFPSVPAGSGSPRASTANTEEL